MVGRIFYTLAFFLLLPIALLLVFKPDIFLSFYSRMYSTKIGTKGGLISTIIKSLLAMTSNEVGELAHRAIGVILTLLALYIFFTKLKIISFP